MSHDPYSPWPQHGAAVRAETNYAYWVTTSFIGHWPIYAFTKKFSARWGRWPFFAFELFGRVRGYIGWKPITLQDTHFYVPDGFSRSAPAVQLSTRLSFGKVPA